MSRSQNRFGINNNNETRTASASGRSKVLFNYPPSEYHEKCVPKNGGISRGAPPPPPQQTPGKLDFGTGKDPVAQDQLWKDYVNGETKRVGEWQENWGFMTEYNDKGQAKTKPELPEKVNMFSENVPNTQTGNYGSRLNTQLAATMQNLEFKFYSGHRKKKTGDDLVCF